MFFVWRFPRWLLLVVVVAAAILPWTWGKAFGRPPAAVDRGDIRYPRVAFACNIDWGTQYVPQILAILKEKGIKITFFPSGRWVNGNPVEAKMLAAAGQEIGSHGYFHLHVATLSTEANRLEMEKAAQTIETVTGVRPTLYAPPYGELSDSVLSAASSLGYTTVLWTADTIDWRPSTTPAEMVSRVLKKVGNGAIILIHPTDRTVTALPILLRELAAKGYTVTTVSAVLGKR